MGSTLKQEILVKTMAKQKDWYAEFRGKRKLNEREVNLLKMRLTHGQIKDPRIPDSGYELTQDQVEKGRRWLMNLWVTPKGVERKNNPFGDREKAALKSFRTIKLIDFYNAGNRYFSFYVPVYEVISTHSGFQYVVYGGQIHIIG